MDCWSWCYAPSSLAPSGADDTAVTNNFLNCISANQHPHIDYIIGCNSDGTSDGTKKLPVTLAGLAVIALVMVAQVLV